MTSESGEGAQNESGTPFTSFEEFQRMRIKQQWNFQNINHLLNPWVEESEQEERILFEKFKKLGHTKSEKSAATASHQSAPDTEVVESKGGACCQSHLGGCDADHGAVHWAETQHQQDGETMFVPIAEDTQSSENWIPPVLVKSCGLTPVELSRPKPCQVATGETFQATHTVTLPLWGDSMPKTQQVRFLLLPSTTPREYLLAGKPFIKDHGHVGHLFDVKPVHKLDLICESDVKEDEKRAKLASKVKADAQSAAIRQNREQKRKTQVGNRSSVQQSPTSSQGKSGSRRTQ